ncbi:hypothetical protein [Zeaxanthinibacter enoshimensis]|uniref:Uncharacterized protein n=1 Tax=Zeaxanthinibacter enoshimensis TaxID=392009 RepID=A0A4R6TJR5_9FLAO|nr:hypothetical protein [Zeaxanthinibacter enoshimensis]TDQ31086.1 hypothetical protein CLV82_1787 [Zeaxanthinibacter enoshimensis]
MELKIRYELGNWNIGGVCNLSTSQLLQEYVEDCMTVADAVSIHLESALYLPPDYLAVLRQLYTIARLKNKPLQIHGGFQNIDYPQINTPLNYDYA